MTDHITPQEAQRLLDGATPGPWEHYDDCVLISLRSERGAIACDLNEWDADLITAAPRLAATIAAMQPIYVVRYERQRPRQFSNPYQWSTLEETHPTLEAAQADADDRNCTIGIIRNARVITRYILESGEPDND